MATNNSESVSSQPGMIKQNVGWILAGLLVIGNLANGIPDYQGISLISYLIGSFLMAGFVGGIIQYFNKWNVDVEAN